MQVTTGVNGIEIGDIHRLCLIMADGTIEEIVPRHHADADDLQDRADNLYRSEWEQGFIDRIIAYDANGDTIGAMSADEFFGERQGF